MKYFIKNTLYIFLFLSFAFIHKIDAQQILSEIKIIKEIPTTSVKNQSRTGTCWSFGTTSFIETELIRMGKGEIGLSEMFTVRCAYDYHAEMYIRYHGHINFTMGAQAWDLFHVIRNYGIVPREVYPGLRINSKMHDHREMDKVLKAIANTLVEQKSISPVWREAYNGALDGYLGEYPAEFEYYGNKYTPESFRDYLGINVDDYETFTSFTHHPYNTEFVFESPDNWSNGIVKNVSMDHLIQIIDNAINKGYSVVWASDVSDKGFNHAKGLAIVPEKDWGEMSEQEKTEAFEKPVKQRKITPEMRQAEYNNYGTTDDHLMHIIGLAEDSNGTKYYKVKNSWGTEGNTLGGFFYASESYVRYRTMTIVTHKNAVPKEIAQKFEK